MVELPGAADVAGDDFIGRRAPDGPVDGGAVAVRAQEALRAVAEAVFGDAVVPRKLSCAGGGGRLACRGAIRA